jgi:hypothetical protein
MKNKGKDKSKKNVGKKKAARKIDRRIKLSSADDCVLRYGKMLVDPFAEDARGACIPDGRGGSTFKFATYARSIVTAGTNYAVLVRPSAANNSQSLQIWWEKNAADAVEDNDNFATYDTATSTGFVNVNAVGSPFATSSFVAGSLEQRCVGYEVRVTNNTLMTYRGGECWAWQAVSYDTDAELGLRVNEATSPSDFTTYLQTKSFSGITGDGQPVLRLASADFDKLKLFRAEHGLAGVQGTPMAGGAMQCNGFIWLPSQVTPGQWKVELIAHWEVRGTSVGVLGQPPDVEAPATANKMFNAANTVIQNSMSRIPVKRIATEVASAAANYFGMPSSLVRGMLMASDGLVPRKPALYHLEL